MRSDGRDLHVLGLCVHVALGVLHGLGVLYNAKRRNRWQAALHGAVAGYDVWAVTQHAKELR